MVEKARVAIVKAEENLIRYTELKSSKGYRGLCTPIVILEYTSFWGYRVAHCMALGLHKHIMIEMRDVIRHDQFINACRRAKNGVITFSDPQL